LTWRKRSTVGGPDPDNVANEGAKDSATMQDLLLVALAAIVPFCNVATWQSGLNDGDSGWHLALGRWILAHGVVPHTDPFSYTAAGQPWTAHEWLTGVLMALVHGATGWSGVVVLYGLAQAVLFASVALYLRRWLAPLPAAIVLVLLAVGLMPFEVARPHVLAWPLLAVWLIVLLRAREAGRAPPLAAALLMTVWANIHGSFALGLALVGPFAAEAVLAEWRGNPWPQVRGWALFGLATLVAALVTPYGIEGLLFPLRLVAMPVLSAIDEWQPTSFATFGSFEAVLLAGLFLCFLRPVKVPPWRLFVLIGMLYLALAHIRHHAVFLIVTVLLLAAPAAPAWGRNGGRPRFALGAALRSQRRETLPLVAVAAVALLGMAVWRVAVPLARPDSQEVPVSAVAALPPGLRSRPVFNDYSFGGTLIEAGYRVFIDGRIDMYGPGLLEEYLKASSGNPRAWRATQERRGIGWAILKTDSPLNVLLDREPGWRRVYGDRWAVVHVRDSAR
jgi:hypothetical protein